MNFDRRHACRIACCLVIFSLLLGGCNKPPEEAPPPPAPLTRDDTGYFCGMIVEDHAGPKSQVFLEGQSRPLWFTTARDGIAFTRLPEETRPVSILYVSAVDLGGWDNPEADPANMIEASAAWFVISSGQRGSMGAPEAIPFSSEQAARTFADEHGGTVVKFADIPDRYVLGS